MAHPNPLDMTEVEHDLAHSLEASSGPQTPATMNTSVDAVIDFTGGTAGGIASVYVGQPLDTVKVKMQTFPTMYKNALQCFLRTYKQEGIARGLYAGTVPSLAAQISENAILFMFYGICQKGVMLVTGKNRVEELSILQNASAGGGAAFFSSLSLCPTELIKCKLQAMREMKVTGQLQPGSPAAEQAHIGPWGLTKQILRQEGIRGLFRGLVPTFAREMPGYFFFFGGYEISRELLRPHGKTKDEIGAVRTVVAGGIGGMALWAAIFPADVIKSRVQVSTGEHNLSFMAMLIKIAKEEGVLALYKGLGPSLLRTFPATGALFLAYETTKKVLSNAAYKNTSSS